MDYFSLYTAPGVVQFSDYSRLVAKERGKKYWVCIFNNRGRQPAECGIKYQSRHGGK